MIDWAEIIVEAQRDPGRLLFQLLVSQAREVTQDDIDTAAAWDCTAGDGIE